MLKVTRGDTAVLNYIPFHNSLPFASVNLHWKTVRNYEKQTVCRICADGGNEFCILS